MAIDYSQIQSKFGDSLENYVNFASYCRWYPDKFLDLCKGPNNGFKLDMDERVLMRSLARFFSTYGCLPRGAAKSFSAQAVQYVLAIWYPGITLAVTAQTKENACKIMKDNYSELTRAYPLLSNEIAKTTFTRNESVIVFKNDSRIDALANSQTSKGQRRKRINVEEAVLVDNFTFQDAIEPIVEAPRYTMGKLGIVDPCELNQQINFLSTPGWRSSDEWRHSVTMCRDMIDLKGSMVIGADWMLPCWFGRGSSKTQILEKRRNMSPTAFAQNYGGTWTGSSDNALIDINHFMACRKLDKAIMQAESNTDEYYMGVDVARSQKTNNNQSSIVVAKVDRDHGTNRVKHVDIVNVMSVPNILNFSAQAAVIKRTAAKYHPKMVICDGNGLGSGLIDKLLENNVDPITQETYEAWDTINTTNQSEDRNAPKCLYDIKAQGVQSRIITDFINMVDSGTLRLLCKREEAELYNEWQTNNDFDITPYVQTDLLFDEVANLKLKYQASGALSVEKVVRQLDKDRFSALVYVLYYISEFASALTVKKSMPIDFFVFRAPKIK